MISSNMRRALILCSNWKFRSFVISRLALPKIVSPLSPKTRLPIHYLHTSSVVHQCSPVPPDKKPDSNKPTSEKVTSTDSNQTTKQDLDDDNAPDPMSPKEPEDSSPDSNKSPTLFPFFTTFPMQPLTTGTALLKLLYLKIFMDGDFQFSTFLHGAREAMFVVSQYIAEGEFDKLSDLLTTECLTDVKEGYANLPPSQQKSIAIPREQFLEVQFTQAFLNLSSPNKSAEITITVTNKNKSLLDVLKKINQPNIPTGDGEVTCVQYRFIRNFPDTEWTVNGLNHYW